MQLEDNGIGDVIERRGSAELVLFQLRHHDSNFVIKIKIIVHPFVKTNFF